MCKIPESELILNKDGSIYHLALRPEEVADTIILVGDPGRVDKVSSFFDKIEVKRQNREIITNTGYFNGKRLTVLSTGMGTDNIDIVINELDALVNIDLNERVVKKQHTSLNLIRIGTSGALQADIPINSYLVSEKSIGFDGLLNFYDNRDKYCDLEFENAFTDYTSWSNNLPAPYVIGCSNDLLTMIGKDLRKGITIAAPGFYGPQGRVLRLNTSDPELNNKIETFSYKNQKITNFEMESSALYGLSKLLGHNALTICAIIANRVNKQYSADYKPVVNNLIETVLNRITE